MTLLVLSFFCACSPPMSDAYPVWPYYDEVRIHDTEWGACADPIPTVVGRGEEQR